MAAFGCRAEALQRATALSDAGAHAQALAVLERALEHGLDDAQLQNARGWALENLVPPRLADARAAYEAAVALDAGQLWARLGLATVLGQLGRSAECPAIYRDLVDQATLRAACETEYLELLGWCQYRLGRLAEAAATFRRALAIDDAWVAVHFDLGLALLVSGAADLALTQYRHGLRCLAGCGPAAQAGPLKVALDDLDEAGQQHPSIAAAALRLRELLQPARPVASNSDA